MTPEILYGLLRSCLVVLSITLANHGITLFDEGKIDTLTGALVTIATAGFSVRAKFKLKKKIAEKVTRPETEKNSL